jgi:hypothetical protein
MIYIYLRIAKGVPPTTFSGLTVLQDIYVGTHWIAEGLIKDWEITPNINEASIGANEQLYKWGFVRVESQTAQDNPEDYGHRTEDMGGIQLDAHTPTIRFSTEFFQATAAYGFGFRYDNRAGEWGAYWDGFSWSPPAPTVAPSRGDGLVWTIQRTPINRLKFPFLQKLRI